jgi:hypothetical protein
MRYWNIARQRHYRSSARCCWTLRVSVDRAARPSPHTRGKPRLLDVPRRILAAAREVWIRRSPAAPSMSSCGYGFGRRCRRAPRHHGRALPAVPPAGHAFVRPRGAYLRAAPRPRGEAPRAWAVCRFVDPIADIAVLGSPNAPHADDYKALTATATALPIADRVRHPVNFWASARLLSLDGRWFSAPSATSAGRCGSPTPPSASSGGCLARRSSRRPGRRSGSCAPPRRCRAFQPTEENKDGSRSEFDHIGADPNRDMTGTTRTSRSTVVVVIVPVTAKPYAEASALELWNPRASARIAINNSQLTCGM